MGTQFPLFQKGGGAPNFWPISNCGQMAGWIKMPLGMDVGLGSGYIVLHGDRAPLLQKGAEPPIFCPYRLWPNGWMDQDATW